MEFFYESREMITIWDSVRCGLLMKVREDIVLEVNKCLLLINNSCSQQINWK